MSFDPGRYRRPVYIDGDASEWDESHRVHEYDGISVYAQQSVQGLYLLVRGEGVNSRHPLYLPIKVTPESGTAFHEHLQFDMPANFLLRVHGANNTRLMVNMRYNANFMRFHEETTGENPFAFVPGRWDSEFVPIMIPLQNTALQMDRASRQNNVIVIEQSRLHSWETGRLRHGINNPNHSNFDSLADFRFGYNLVEIRIPWVMLNFFDPSTLRVHADYYDNFGVEGLDIEQIYIGVGRRDSSHVAMSPIRLHGWRGDLQFHERLKLSYYIMQEAWRR